MLEPKPTAPTHVPAPVWFGPFYCNPEDPRVILPKRWGYGYTFNFARPAARAILLALLVVPPMVSAIVLALVR
jgi:uncharacterized membrane protein